jgi:hypothetical protein
MMGAVARTAPRLRTRRRISDCLASRAESCATRGRAIPPWSGPEPSERRHRGYWDDDFSRAPKAALEHRRGEGITWLAPSVRIQNLTGIGVRSEFTHYAGRIFRGPDADGRAGRPPRRSRAHPPIHLGEVGWIRPTGDVDDWIYTTRCRPRQSGGQLAGGPGRGGRSRQSAA